MEKVTLKAGKVQRKIRFEGKGANQKHSASSFQPLTKQIKSGVSPSAQILQSKLLNIFNTLFATFGPQHWWPANSPFEVIIGAILTQNTSWKNVEKAIINLHKAELLAPFALDEIDIHDLSAFIRPAGYFNIKARRIKAFVTFLMDEYGGDLNKLFEEEHQIVRIKLLQIHGIGPETADAILLYAGGYPSFVVDAYTIRVLSRHNIVPHEVTYDEVQNHFMDNLPNDPNLFNEYHALLVKVGKEYCRKKDPLCLDCPLTRISHRVS